MVFPPEIIANIIKYIKTRDLGKYLTINNIWRSEIIRELYIRREYFTKKHRIAYDIYESLRDEQNSLIHKIWMDGSFTDNTLIKISNKKLTKSSNYRQHIFEQQVAVERVLLYNGLVDKVFDIYIMKRNIEYQENGHDSCEVFYDTECIIENDNFIEHFIELVLQ